jgi:hypothetical protein
VTRAGVIAGLLRLRRAKEQRALEAFVRCDGHHRRAERQVDTARDAVDRHAMQAQARERALVRSMLGRRVAVSAVARLCAERDFAAGESARLRRLVADAEAALQDSQRARDAAREWLGQCRRATVKLDYVAAQERRAAMRRQLGLAEAGEQIYAGA